MLCGILFGLCTGMPWEFLPRTRVLEHTGLDEPP